VKEGRTIMPNGHYNERGHRDAPNRTSDRNVSPARARTGGGGRTEQYAHERDREQRSAGYPERDWERDQESHRTVHSEPDWDPTRFARPQRKFGSDAVPSTALDDERRAHYGYDDGYDVDQRRNGNVASGGRNDASNSEFARGFPGGRRSAEQFEQDYRHHEQSLSSEIGNAGRRLIGKVKRLVRNPKNYTRSDERIREDVCDGLSVSHEVDPSEIEVSVSAGEVTLTGTVSDRQMKFIAEEIADEVAGVHDVHNQLRVQRPAPAQTNSNVSINSQDPGRGGKNIGRS
jgi:hypothetical protein